MRPGNYVAMRLLTMEEAYEMYPQVTFADGRTYVAKPVELAAPAPKRIEKNYGPRPRRKFPVPR